MIQDRPLTNLLLFFLLLCAVLTASCQRTMMSQLNRSADNALTNSVIGDIDDEMLNGIFEISRERSPRYLFVFDEKIHQQRSLIDIRDRANQLEASVLRDATSTLQREVASRSPSADKVAQSARRLLASGKLDGVADLLRQARAKNSLSISEARRIDEVMAEAFVLMAERENCVCDSNAESCIFPLRGGGIHANAEPAQEAHRLYRSLA